MSNRLLNKRFLIAFLASAGLALTLAQFPVFGQVADLDELSDEELQQALDDELGDDDLAQFGIVDLDAEISDAELVEIILDCLQDDGDDATEQRITWRSLEREMNEAGTTVRRVVEQAVKQADQMDSRQRFPTFALVNFSRYRSSSEFTRLAVGPVALEDGRTTPRGALPLVKIALRTTVQKLKA